MKKMFDLSYFIGKSYFNDDKIPNYLIFQPVFEFFQTFSSAVVEILDEKGLPDLNSCYIKQQFLPKLTYIHNSKIAAKFKGNCLSSLVKSYCF